MVIGRCFRAKYEKTHEDPTITDFNMKCRWAFKFWGPTYQK
jgi:hypothetical protein